MTALGIPASPEDLTADWLTGALRRGGFLQSGSVGSFESDAIGVGTGFLGKLARLTLDYEGDAAGAPRTAIAKFPVLDPASREVAMLFRFYEREVRFYEQIGPRISLRIPRVYHSAIDTTTGNFVILMEDMAPARVGDQLDSCVAAQAERAIHDIAAFHAEWWGSPELESMAWMPRINDPINQSAEQAFQQAWPAFLSHMGEKVTSDLREVGEGLSTRIIAILDALAERPMTIVHGDYRLDNLFFACADGGEPLSVVDWQIANRGVGTFDVAYFLTGNIAVQTRRAHEQDWLRMYHNTLLKGGVRDYSFDECLLDYRLSALFCLVYNVIGVGSLDFGNERGLALFDEWTARTAAALVDLDCAALLP